MPMKMGGASQFPREELSSASPHGDVQLFPLPTGSETHFQHAQFSLCLVVGLKAPNPCRQLPKGQSWCWKMDVLGISGHLSQGAPCCHTQQFSSSSSSFSQSQTVVGAQCEEEQKRNRTSGQGQVLLGRSSVPNVNYRRN